MRAIVKFPVIGLVTATAVACGSGADGATTKELPSDAVAIMSGDEYRGASWSYLVVDPGTGEVILDRGGDAFVPTASMIKTLTVGTAYETLGVERTLRTPVRATGPVDAGVLDGDLVLVASGDLGLGGRGSLDGRFDFSPIDHVYADAIPGASILEDTDPLAGLDTLARQIADRGITAVAGDVVIDDGLWEEYEAQEGPVPSIFVNDNLVDIIAEPNGRGEATVTIHPATAAFTLDSSVSVDPAADVADLEVAVDANDPRVLQVRGSIPADGASLTVHRVEDPASWARTLFVEALDRAGVRVSAAPLQPNDAASLPDDVDALPEVAGIESAPIGEMGAMILATSYNTGANTFLCLLAAERGSRTCTDGLDTIRSAAVDAGIDPEDLVLVDGQGGHPASAPPAALVDWLTWVRDRPWSEVFVAGLPALGERGSLAGIGVGTEAQGKVRAKTGTAVAMEPGTGRMFTSVQGLAGYLEVGRDEPLVFVLAVEGAVFPDVGHGIVDVGTDVAEVAAALQADLNEG